MDKLKPIIIDNSFEKFLIIDVLKKLNKKNIPETWYFLNSNHDYKVLCKSLLNECAKYYDLSKSVGYEFWTRNNTRPSDWHYDKDENFYHNTGKYKFPICTIVYYLQVENLKGGVLHLEDITISPKQNRMIIFPPGINHYVEEFTGNRVSVIINPWDYNITTIDNMRI